MKRNEYIEYTYQSGNDGMSEDRGIVKDIYT